MLRFVQIEYLLSPTTQNKIPRRKFMKEFLKKNKTGLCLKEIGLFPLKKKSNRKDIQSEESDKKNSLYKRDGGGRVIVSSGRCFLCPYRRGHAPLLPLQGTKTTVSTHTLHSCYRHHNYLNIPLVNIHIKDEMVVLLLLFIVRCAS